MRVFKFGGTSMATPNSILKVVEIINKQSVDIVVVSAPGKRTADDDKITDLLFDCHAAFLKSGRCDVPFLRVEKRIASLAEGVGLTGIKPYLDQIRHDINAGAGLGYTVSRGEFLCALIMRHLLNCEFIDAKELIKFDITGNIDLELSYSRISSRLKGCGRAVVPGYYGVMPGGEIKTFTRGGSDVSAAIIAAGANADEYQNWTDVDGVYFCPLIDICEVVPALSYQDMRQLAFLGGSVLHPDSLPPLMEKGIEVRVKNTFNPDAAGTLITTKEKAEKTRAENTKTVKAKLKKTESESIEAEYDKLEYVKTEDEKSGNVKAISVKKGYKDGKIKDNNEKNGYNADAMPVAVSGCGGFKLLSIYARDAGECYVKKLVAVCEQRGAKIFTAAYGIDQYEIILSGETGRLKDCEKTQNIAVMTVLHGDKNMILRNICSAAMDILFLQWTGQTGIILGVKEEELEDWLKFFCRLKSSEI